MGTSATLVPKRDGNAPNPTESDELGEAARGGANRPTMRCTGRGGRVRRPALKPGVPSGAYGFESRPRHKESQPKARGKAHSKPVSSTDLELEWTRRSSEVRKNSSVWLSRSTTAIRHERIAT